MKFVSCIAVSDVVDEESQGDVVLCECDLGEVSLPVNEQELGELKIKELVVSEGNEIHRRRAFGCKDLNLFTGTDEEKSSLRGPLWHELLKLLTGHRIQVDSLTETVEFTRWVCHAPEDDTWFLVMELEAEGIVRKIAQLELQSVTKGEVDLFQMTSRLFTSYCESNDTARALSLRVSELETSINALREEMETLENVRQDRDSRTRSIMAGILNEKKRKIVQLEQELKKKNSSSSLCDVSDSEIINKNVKEAVSELISPGKRKLRMEQMRDDHKLKKSKRKLFPSPKTEAIDDFDDDFQFFGITKPKEGAPSGSTTPKIPAVKHESQEGMQESDSQISDPVGPQSQSRSDKDTDTDADTETEATRPTESSSESDTDVSSTQ